MLESLASSVNLKIPGLGFTCANMYRYFNFIGSLSTKVATSQSRNVWNIRRGNLLKYTYGARLDYIFVLFCFPVLHDQCNDSIL